MKRTGLSLLEVLISVFILTVGVLSVVALIPVGTHNMLETSKLDRGSALARAALRDVKTMGLLDRRLWCDAKLNANSLIANNPAFPTFAINPVVPNITSDPLLGQAFMIDPLGIAQYYEDVAAVGGTPSSAITRFPYLPGPTDPNDLLHIPRLSVTMLPLGYGNPVLRRGFFERLFVCPDDALLHVPEEGDARPAQQFTFSDGSFSYQVPDPSSAGSGDPVPIARQAEGHYSWLLTAVPIPNDTPGDATKLHLDHQRRYRVSIVVFFKRSFDFDGGAERRAFVQILGGGDVRLLIDAANDPEALELKRNEWLLLFASKTDQRLDYNPGVGFPGYRKVAHWFRVVGLDQEPVRETMADGKDYWTRYVTLAGPDWDRNTRVGGPTVPSSLNIDACAFLMDNIVAVHTTELEVEK